MKDRTTTTHIISLAVFAMTSPSVLPDSVYPWAAPVHSKQWFNQQPDLPPLDSSVIWARKTVDDLCDRCTGQILSLIYEQGVTEKSVYPWPFYIQLDTAHNTGDATGTYARVYNRGSGWAAAHHGEVIAYSAGSTNIGFNTEMSPIVPDSRVIGLNLLAKNGYTEEAGGQWSNEAINIQNDPGVGWMTGIKFDGTTIDTGIDFTPASAGTHAIRIWGKYEVGLDMGSNSIRLSAGTKICLEETDQFCVRFNAQKRRLEFLNGSSVLGYLHTGKVANRCLNC